MLTIGFDVGANTSGVATVIVDLFGRISDPTTGKVLYLGPLSPTLVTLNYAWLYGFTYLQLSEGSAYTCDDEPWPLNYDFSCCAQCPMGIGTWLTGTFPAVYDAVGNTITLTGWPWWLAQPNIVLKGVGSGVASIVYPSCVEVTLPPIPTCPAPTTPAPPTTQPPTTAPATTTPPPTTTAAPSCTYQTSPDSMDFYEQYNNYCALPQNFDWINNGQATYDAFNYTVTGSIAGDWTMVVAEWTCTAPLLPGQTCTLQVQFCTATPPPGWVAVGQLTICANCSVSGAGYCSTIPWMATNPFSTTAPPTTSPAPTTTPPPTTTTPPTTTPAPTTTPPPATLPACSGDFTYSANYDFGSAPIRNPACQGQIVHFPFTCGNDNNVWSNFAGSIVNDATFDFALLPYFAPLNQSTCFAPGYSCTLGGSCNVAVQFCPSGAGLFTGTLVVYAACTTPGGYQYLPDGSLSGTGVVALADESIRHRAAKRGLPGVYPEPTCVPQPTTTSLAASTTATTSTSATSSAAALTSSTSTTAASSTTTSATTTSVASTSAASTTSNAATLTTAASTTGAAASTSAAATTSSTNAVSTAAATSTSGITTAVSAATTTGATATTSFATSTGATLPPAYPNEYPSPSPYLETCQVTWIVPEALTDSEPWYDQSALWPRYDFANPAPSPVEFVFGCVNLINLAYVRNFDNPTLDYCGGPLTGTDRDQVLESTNIFQVSPSQVDPGGAFYAPGTNGYAQYTITNSGNSLYNNCPYSSFFANFDYGLANYCTMSLAFDPDLCYQQQPNLASGTCISYACQYVSTPFYVSGPWHSDCVLLAGTYINAPGATEPGLFPFDVQRNASEPWARTYMLRETKRAVREHLRRTLLRPGWNAAEVGRILQQLDA
ncbi:MAG: hypothetical protein KGR26_00075 [Cyanobacteria bacterium REEB65]|nr:hypothetical protein [Cyanobacteria bacterium REEB65]